MIREWSAKLRMVALMFSGISLMALATACEDHSRSDPPDPESLHYPYSLVADPAGDYIYVCNTNFDAMFQGGTIVPWSVTQNRQVNTGAAWIGSFGGNLAFDLNADNDASRLLVTIRDSDEIEFLDISRTDLGVPLLSCSDDGAFEPCDANHRFDLGSFELLSDGSTVEVVNPLPIKIGARPVVNGIPGAQPIYVGSVTSGILALGVLPNGGKPVFDRIVELEAGLHSIIEWRVYEDTRILFVSNRLTDKIHVVRLRLDGDHVVSAWQEQPANSGLAYASGDYFRGLATSNVSRAMYASYRSPASFVRFDVEGDGSPLVRDILPLNGEPGDIAVYNPSTGAYPELVYVTDFANEAVWVVDPVGMNVVDRVVVGDGPYGIAIAGDKAFITLFEASQIVALDIDPESPTYHQVVEGGK